MEVLEETTDTATITPPTEETDQDERSREDEELNCASCGHAITRSKHRTGVGGQFQHTVVNPAGILFEIGCFSQAEGCREIGPESDDFSWFEGYVWQVAICTSCKSHLGWRFWSSDNEFYGLILNRLS